MSVCYHSVQLVVLQAQVGSEQLIAFLTESLSGFMSV